MKFQVLEGQHVKNGRVYEKDEVVTDERDLTKVFVNKFRRLPETAEPARKKDVYALEECGDYKYTIINKTTGKPINNNKMSKSSAESFLKELNG